MNKKIIVSGVAAIALVALIAGGIYVWSTYGSILKPYIKPQPNDNGENTQPPETGTTKPSDMMPPAQIITGPGGCSSPETCMKYCIDPSHIAECAQFGGNTIPITTTALPLASPSPFGI